MRIRIFTTLLVAAIVGFGIGGTKTVLAGELELNTPGVITIFFFCVGAVRLTCLKLMRFGLSVAGSMIRPLQIRISLGRLGSLVSTVIFRVKLPLNLPQLIMISRFSVWPGLMVRSDRPLYRVPHPPLALIRRSAVPSLRIMNEKVRVFWPRQTGSSVDVF